MQALSCAYVFHEACVVQYHKHRSGAFAASCPMSWKMQPGVCPSAWLMQPGLGKDEKGKGNCWEALKHRNFDEGYFLRAWGIIKIHGVQERQVKQSPARRGSIQ